LNRLRLNLTQRLDPPAGFCPVFVLDFLVNGLLVDLLQGTIDVQKMNRELPFGPQRIAVLAHDGKDLAG
jgi:hypothetical protein